ncbi:MAG: GGDEF domain-containing protein [Marinobacter sp.]|uniref:GGDEF domain-containing protein n=1 Tax=Marinobacter sp. TaxID=50741 RepID=UPI0035616A43
MFEINGMNAGGRVCQPGLRNHHRVYTDRSDRPQTVSAQVRENDDVFYRDLWRHLTDRVFEELKLREKASHDSLADIDDFKPVNDRFGHRRGDDIIKTVANILLAETRKTDKCIRWGGEEFIVLLPFCGLARVRAR